MELCNIYKEFKDTPNKVYFIEKHKSYILSRFLFVGIILAFIGFFIVEDNHLFKSLTNSLQMLILNLPTDYKSWNIFLLISSLLIAVTFFYAIITTFFKEVINKKIVSNIQKDKFTFIFGLGYLNETFLRDYEKNKNIIIVENNANNKYIDKFREKGFGVIIQDIFDDNYLKNYSYSNMEYGIIALGDDQKNIDFAIKLIDHIQGTNNKIEKRLIVHIENSELKELFNLNLLNLYDLNKAKIDIKTFSYFEECSNDLFEKHSFISNQKIKTNDEIKTLILGNGDLAINIIKDLLILSNLPNKNKHTIYLIDETANDFLEKVKLKTFYSKEKFPTINIIPINIGYKNIKYFKEDIFTNNDISNIFICYDDEKTNLNLSIELNNKIFLRHETKAKLFLALFEDYSFIKNSKLLNKFLIFGNKKYILSNDRLIDEKNYSIAKLIHNGYGDEFKRENLSLIESDLNTKWFKIDKYSDRLSNIAQTKHLNIKLQALGLTKEKSSDCKQTILKKNIEIFDKVLDKLLQDDYKKIKVSSLKEFYEKIHKASLEFNNFYKNPQESYKVIYFPKEFQTIFEKLIESEHERWNAYHYINGWEYIDAEQKDKDKKLHHCLKQISKFDKDYLKMTFLYDVYSILYIPNYLANAGFEIKINLNEDENEKK
ncbi:NAD-binding protein [Aliarcobacter cryaerophilus]|uniref:NAD-binding protein n=1 Tax=Aliarcobacter cryaerophilus TaxID=28198 RepID=UPI0021B61A24|nr:NAD-binding protein [Aliarcobacter cryaerophilus]MCT7492560.1 NAD-binding protein [Aliarcobacter cryaerophilus]